MKPVRIIFFGTHTFAATILRGLLNFLPIAIEGVVTQPDRPIGREKKINKSPVKLMAEERGLPTEQPATLKDYELRTRNYELGIVAQYGLIIPKQILDSFPRGVLNVHTSLLPKYRGASPIQSALINGESETGITIMKMDAGMDTGPILAQKKIVIDPDEAYPTLEQRLAPLGVITLQETIPGYLSGGIVPRPQDNTEATTCALLTRDDGRIDWQQSKQKIYNRFRGLTPWPGLWTTWNNLRLKLLRIRPSDKTIEPGRVSLENNRLMVGCADGSMEIIELQLDGKRPMDIQTFLRGHKTFVHEHLI